MLMIMTIIVMMNVICYDVVNYRVKNEDAGIIVNFDDDVDDDCIGSLAQQCLY